MVRRRVISILVRASACAVPKRCDRQCVCQRLYGSASVCTFFQARARPRRLSACSGECGLGQDDLVRFQIHALHRAEGFRRYAHIFQNNFGMSVRCVIKPEYRQHADNFNAGDPAAPKPGLLLVQRGVGLVLPITMRLSSADHRHRKTTICAR